MSYRSTFRRVLLCTAGLLMCGVCLCQQVIATCTELPVAAQAVISRLETAYPDPLHETGIWRAVVIQRSRGVIGELHEVVLASVMERYPSFSRMRTFQMHDADSSNFIGKGHEILKSPDESLSARDQVTIQFRTGSMLVSFVKWSNEESGARVNVWEDCPSKNHDWSLAMGVEDPASAFRGFFADERVPFSVLLRTAKSVGVEPLSPEEQKLFSAKFVFELPNTAISVWTSHEFAGFPTRVVIERNHEALINGEPVWQYMRRGLDHDERTAPLDPLDRKAKCTSVFEVVRMSGAGQSARLKEYKARFETTDRNGDRQTFDSEAVLLDYSPAGAPQELTSLLAKLPDGIEVAYRNADREDGLYRQWRNGKPVVVERPKVQETIDDAVQQTPAVTGPPDSSRAPLYLLLGGAALLIALAVGLSWYHARAKR